MSRLLEAFQWLLRFYPFQLPLYQLRRHFFLSLLWVILWLIALKQIGHGFGVAELFYTPATGIYPDFTSTLSWGVAYGIFVVAYHLTTYLLDGHHAGFLLREKSPFLSYAVNNSLLPLSFWVFYLHIYTQYHHEDPNFGEQLLGHVVGVLGVTLILLIGLERFSRDILQLKKLGLLPPHRIYFDVTKVRPASAEVHYYIALWQGIRSTADFVSIDKKALTKLLLKYHRNAFLVELGLLILISGWGYIQTQTEVYLPAASAFLIFWAIIYMLFGAVSFWLKQWGGWALLSLLGLAGFLIYRTSLWESRSAYGLRYKSSSSTSLQRDVQRDSLVLVSCLDAWRRRQGEELPPLVWVQVSGGGWRSAFWTLTNLQLLDSLSGGLLWQRCFAISGASGGLIGAAFWRELGLFYPQERWNQREAFYLTRDALNPVIATAVTNFFTPTLKFRDSLSGESYAKAREYAFERALIRNSRAFGERRIGDYALLERTGRCPLLFITPALLPVGKQLLISSQPCSPLLRQGYMEELRQLVPDADHLRLTTALRMNASFPFVLPPVRLPTSQPLEAVDAGAIDNFGEIIALRFLWNMREAISQRASKVILIEIRDLPLSHSFDAASERSGLGEFVRRLGGLYASFTGARQILTRFSYEVMQRSYPLRIEKYVLAYEPRNGYYPPLGFTLSPADQAIMLRTLRDSLHVQRLIQLANALK
ncbi:MAG: hypothetical protein N2253_00940 [Bacteroidia bacterium]|nr:hypothetical protein [Bacteroidia bacterium]MCX7763443.1 hypothetical protein [Bacteroidia bacterium]MDW8056990.1 hypothetical protein [Bacteroidia bacterium]